MRCCSIVSLPFRGSGNGNRRQLPGNLRKRFSPMSLSPNLELLLIGCGIGLGIAAVGGFTEYWISLRRDEYEGQQRLPGCLFYVVGGLAVAGIMAMATSVLAGKGIMPALIVGAGVLGGFYTGFICLFILWFLINR